VAPPFRAVSSQPEGLNAPVAPPFRAVSPQPEGLNAPVAPPFWAVSWQPDVLHASSRRGVGGSAPPETHPRPAPPQPDRLHVPSRARLCPPSETNPPQPPPHPTRTIRTPPYGGSAFPPATHHPAPLPRPTTASHLGRSIPAPPSTATPSVGGTSNLPDAQFSAFSVAGPISPSDPDQAPVQGTV
jgi:hypothetical protein